MSVNLVPYCVHSCSLYCKRSSKWHRVKLWCWGFFLLHNANLMWRAATCVWALGPVFISSPAYKCSDPGWHSGKNCSSSESLSVNVLAAWVHSPPCLIWSLKENQSWRSSAMQDFRIHFVVASHRTGHTIACLFGTCTAPMTVIRGNTFEHCGAPMVSILFSRLTSHIT